MVAILQGYKGYVGFGVQSALITAVTPTIYQHIEAGTSLKENQPGRAAIGGIIKSRNKVTTKKGNMWYGRQFVSKWLEPSTLHFCSDGWSRILPEGVAFCPNCLEKP